MVLQTGFEPALYGLSFHFLYRGLGYWSRLVTRGTACEAGGGFLMTICHKGHQQWYDPYDDVVGRAGLEPACFRVVGLRPTAIAAMPPAGKMVGVERFELSAFWSQTRRSSQTELRPDNGVTDGA